MEKLLKVYVAKVETTQMNNYELIFNKYSEAIGYLQETEKQKDIEFIDIVCRILFIDEKGNISKISEINLEKSLKFDKVCKWTFEENLNTYDYLKICSNMCDHDIEKYSLNENFDAYKNDDKGLITYLVTEASARNYTFKELKEDKEELEEAIKDWKNLEVIGNYKFSFIL